MRSVLPAVRKLVFTVVHYGSRGDRYEDKWSIDAMIKHGLSTKHYIGFTESQWGGKFWFDDKIKALKMLMSQLWSDYPPPKPPAGPFAGNYMTPHGFSGK